MRLSAAILPILMLWVAVAAHAQIVLPPDETPRYDTDSLLRLYDSRPYFGLYKDNYFTVGTAAGPKPTSTNSDVKFQISIAQRLTKSTLPGKTYLFLFYSQKCLWNVFEESLPMHDLNFNPGIGLSKWLIAKDRLVGKLTLLIEHESNGKDGEDSRSWNKVSLSASIFVDPTLMIHGKYWIPIIDGENNKDILRYSGIYQSGVQYMSTGGRFGAAVILTKRKGWDLNFNTIVEVNYRLFKQENQYLFLQYYNGYGENLLDYNRFHSRLRVGIVIKPEFFSDY